MPSKLRGATARNLELLRCIATGPAEFSLKELADKSGLPPSTVHRLIVQWVRQDLLEHEGPKTYRIGPELFRVGSLLLQKFEARRLARPLLTALGKQWQETAVFCLFNPSTQRATVADCIPSPQPLKYELPLNCVISLAWGSLGRAILAHLPAADIDAILLKEPSGPISLAPLPSRKTMLRELDAIRARRYALYHSLGVNVAGVSAAVLRADGRIIGSLGVIMPASRFTKAVQQRLPAAVVESARQLGSLLASE